MVTKSRALAANIHNFTLAKLRWFTALPLYKKIILIGGAVLALSFVFSIGSYAYFARDIANQERLMNRKNTGVVLTDRHDKPFFSFYQAKHTENISIADIPDSAERALIATEDQRFYEHGGYSFKSILAALYANISNQELKKYGGSTITQQLVKNVLLTNDKSFLRKYQELSLAIAIERHYSKEQILEMYLNSVYFGEGAFGIESAAQVYFSKPAKDLTLAESSFLIGLLPAPSTYSPVSGDKDLAEERQALVLSRMQDAGYIDESEKMAAQDQPIEIRFKSDGQNLHAQHFALMVIEELNEKYGEERVIRSGFTVKTTLDLEKQKQAEQIVKDRIASISASGADNAAVVASDPKTGEILTLVGSADWSNEEYGKVNMAITPRQPGSSFKPIYYTKALEEKIITPATIMQDKPTTFGGTYRPENYDFKYRGDITVRRALANSLNIPSVAILEKLGVDEAKTAARDLGISTISDDQDYGLSLALGTAEVKLNEMVHAYSAYANGGKQLDQTIISEIQDKYRHQAYKARPRSSQVIGEAAAFLISSVLSDNEARAATFGSSLNIGKTAAVKTGTTEDNRDAWTIGYTPDLVVGVWVGNNRNQPMTGIGGSSGAGPIWRSLMHAFLEGSPSRDFVMPRGVMQSWICSSNGRRADTQFAGTYREYFIDGSVPKDRCDAPRQEKQEDKKEEKKPEEKREEPKPEEKPNQKPEEADEEPEDTPPPDEEPENPTTPPGEQPPTTNP